MSAQLPELLPRKDVTIPGQFRTALLADGLECSNQSLSVSLVLCLSTSGNDQFRGLPVFHDLK